MRQMYYCPNCRAPFAYGARYCSNCGISLNCVLQQMPFHPSPLPHGNPYAQQQTCRQQPGQNQDAPYNRASAGGNPNQYQQQCACGNRGAIPQQKSPPVEDTATPIRAEISKLLTELFDKAH